MIRRPIFLCILILLAVGISSISGEEEEKSWWEKAIGEVSEKANAAGRFIKDTAIPTISDKFNEASDAIQDPENHKVVKDFVVEKYDAAAKFTKEEIVPGVEAGWKKAYETVAGDKPSSNDDN